MISEVFLACTKKAKMIFPSFSTVSLHSQKDYGSSPHLSIYDTSENIFVGEEYKNKNV
jgi:hypothetical protein